jgi:hypothetical protein
LLKNRHNRTKIVLRDKSVYAIYCICGGNAMAEETKRAAVYVPWGTFKNALEQLSNGIPSRIDRSVFTGMAWNVQNQLFAGMKFLGLIKDDDAPTSLLDDLVKGTEEDRRAKLRKILEERYADLIAMDLTKATRAHFEERLGELYSVSGDTREKASRFFLNAASYVGIPLSSFIAPAKDGSANGAKRPRAIGSRPRATRKAAAPTPPAAEESSTPSGTSKTVSLASGGTLTLSATLDLFSLNAGDRKFVFELIDKLENYGKQVSS